MLTREDAYKYSCDLIHKLVFECSRTGLTRKRLCLKLNMTEQQLATWVTGSRACQLYWTIRNAEDILKELKGLEDNHYCDK